MTMEYHIRSRDPAGVVLRALPYLLQREAANNLLIALLQEIKTMPERGHSYLAAVERNDQVLLVALQDEVSFVLSTTDDLDAVRGVASDVHDNGLSVPRVTGPTEVADAFLQEWQRLTGAHARPGRSMRIYELRSVTPAQAIPGRLRLANAAEFDPLFNWCVAFAEEVGDAMASPEHARALVNARLAQRALYVWEDGQVVSMAAVTGKTPHGIRISLVYTPPEKRHKGYASACVAHLSQRMLDQGLDCCFLYTDLANPTTNHIYQLIGYKPVCDVSEYSF